jgi:uncharacterized protein (DUF924 family)
MKNLRLMLTEPEAVIEYWIGASDPQTFKNQTRRWYIASADTDQFIEATFGDTLRAAEAHKLDPWKNSPTGCLALVILLDQFSRNLYRGTPKAYQNDPLALQIARQLISSGTQLSIPARIVAYHPLHHAEDLAMQEMAVDLFSRLVREADKEWQEQLEAQLRSAKGHRDVIQRFSRFPHRNQVLGRESSAEELGFIARDRRTYGQSP